MIPVPEEDDGLWYEEEISLLFGEGGSFRILGNWLFLCAWQADIFKTLSDAYQAAKAGDRVAQRLLKETYERYIVAKLTG